MQPTFQINIADPCHEDWSKMNPVELGRFCSSCQKKVVDFTTQTDEEIISFFNNYKENMKKIEFKKSNIDIYTYN